MKIMKRILKQTHFKALNMGMLTSGLMLACGGRLEPNPAEISAVPIDPAGAHPSNQTTPSGASSTGISNRLFASGQFQVLRKDLALSSTDDRISLKGSMLVRSADGPPHDILIELNRAIVRGDADIEGTVTDQTA